MGNDFFFIIQWWAVFFVIGIIFLPLVSRIFSNFFDYGYIFSKVIGLVFITYLVFLIGYFHIVAIDTVVVFFVVGLFVVINAGVSIRARSFFPKFKPKELGRSRRALYLIAFEEAIFFVALVFWAYIRGHEPSLNSLEKFMDFGFLNSILRGDFFPPRDMWYTSESINYYYFGHMATAIVTRLSNLSAAVAYNLMIATLFAFALTCAFSIGFQLMGAFRRAALFLGVLSGLLVAFSGNLHVLYAFFGSYTGDVPTPIWRFFGNFPTSILSFPNSYWYPNATRFIEKTIHEFPIYSFVVSDLHGHVLSIPFVLTTLAILLSLLLREKVRAWGVVLLGFFVSVMYMTNAMDGVLYMGLSLVFIAIICLRQLTFVHGKKLKNYLVIQTTIKQVKNLRPTILSLILYSVLLVGGYVVFSYPFNSAFSPFVSGIGVLCVPVKSVLQIGPFLFEPDHCQRSPLWQLLILYGFFLFFTISLFVFYAMSKMYTFKRRDLYVVVIALFSYVLIIVPEFVYAKDIYPDHYRANTMFKLVYQAFMMLSIVSAYSAVVIITFTRKVWFVIVSFLLIGLVMIYPWFAIVSYYGDLQVYRGLDGIRHFALTRPDDLATITYLNENVPGQPVVVEAQGDSYTDYGRISANTGLPTILGWTVHEWLWRGTYDVVAPRIDEVRQVYESDNLESVESILDTYNVEYIYVGGLEREKYPTLNEQKFLDGGYVVVFTSGDSRLYKRMDK